MAEQHNDAVIHYFDPVNHRIACGIPGFDRSTKHARQVNCPSCNEQLHRDAGAQPADKESAAQAR